MWFKAQVPWAHFPWWLMTHDSCPHPPHPPHPRQRAGKGKIDVALDSERRKFYKLKTQLSNYKAENGFVIWSWCFQKHLWERVLSQWENISSAPQTRKGRKVGFLPFFSSKRPADLSDLGTALFQATGAFISKWPFFDTCPKTAWWQAAPTPTGHCSWFPTDSVEARLNLHF